MLYYYIIKYPCPVSATCTHITKLERNEDNRHDVVIILLLDKCFNERTSTRQISEPWFGVLDE